MNSIDLFSSRWVIKEPNFRLSNHEIHSSDPIRNSAIPGSKGDGLPADIEFRSPNCTLINLYIHDLRGVGFWSDGWGLMKGCLIQDIGWDAPDRGHGHALYSQNKLPNLKTIESNIFIKAYGDGVQIYGSDQSFIQGYRISNNIILDNRWLIGGSPVKDVKINDCFCKGSLQLGYQTDSNVDIEVFDLILLGNLRVNPTWESVRFQNNVVYGDVVVDKNVAIEALDFNHNIYIGTRFNNLSFSDWKLKYHQDSESQWFETPQDAAQVLFFPLIKTYWVQEYDHRANFAIWNPNAGLAIAPEQTESLFDGIVELRQVRNYKQDRRLYYGEKLIFEMRGEVKLPNGDYFPQYHPNLFLPNLFPQVGVFELWDVC